MTTPTQLTPMEIITTGLVSVMTLNIYASALGMIVAAMGPAALEAPLAKLKATDPAVAELSKAYGDVIVGKALADVPEADAIELAQRVEYHVYQDLRAKYGDWAADRAIEGAPPGDLVSAIEIAKVLREKRVDQYSPPIVQAKAVARGKLRGRSKAEPVRDTRTGIVYRSKYAAGAAVAKDYPGLDPKNTYVWFAILKKDPKRFTPA